MLQSTVVGNNFGAHEILIAISKGTSMELRQQLYQLLKSRRISVQLDALNRLADFYTNNLENESLSAFVSKVSNLVSLYGSRNTIVSIDIAEKIIQHISKDSNKQCLRSTRVVDIFQEVPTISLAKDMTTVCLKESTGLKIFDTPENMLEMYRIRYKLLLSRALENVKASSLEQRESYSPFPKDLSYFTPIQNLNSTDQLHVNLFGILGKFQGDKYFIEDETGYIELDFGENSFLDRIYTQGCFVLLQGEWNGRVLLVTHMQMPSLKASSNSMIENKTLWQSCPADSDGREENQVVIILSDIWLDWESTLHKLERLFRTLRQDNICPDTVVLMGNFLSPAPNLDQEYFLRNGFQYLATLLHAHISNDQCQVVIVPGPNDPGIGEILPRPPPILNSFLTPLRHSFKFVTLTSNPTRLVCQDTTILLYRDNIQKKLVSHSVFHLSTDPNRLEVMLVETMLDQGHLCPLPTEIQPVFWHHEQSLWLFPPPSLLVLGCDGLKPFQHVYEQTKCFGTGSFALEGHYLMYESTKHHMKVCKIENK